MYRILYYICILIYSNNLLNAQNLFKGDLMIAGVNQLNRGNNCSSNNSETSYDNILFITLNDIENGEVITLTDNRYLGNQQFNTTEGFYQLERVGGKISQGSFFRIDLPFISVANNPIFNGWKLINSYYRINLNTTGDQIFILNNGTWNNQGYFDGDVIFGYNSLNAWKSTLDTSNSRLPTSNNGNYDITNFHYTPLEEITSMYRIYNGPLDAKSKNEWQIRFMNPKNWIYYDTNSNLTNCQNFNEKSDQLLNTKLIIENYSYLENCNPFSIQLETINDENIIDYEWIKSDEINFSNYENIGSSQSLNYQNINNSDHYVTCKLTYQLKWIEDNNHLQISTRTVLSKIYHIKKINSPVITPILIN